MSVCVLCMGSLFLSVCMYVLQSVVNYSDRLVALVYVFRYALIVPYCFCMYVCLSFVRFLEVLRYVVLLASALSLFGDFNWFAM